MNENELNEIREVVQGQLDSISESIREAVSDEAAQRSQELEASIAKIAAELKGLASRGDTSPTAEKVKEMEARLDESEAKLGEAHEQLRIMKAHPALPDPTAIEKVDFKGVFLRSVEEARKAFRNRWIGETRAIDSTLFVGGAGQLGAEQANAFIDYVVSQQVALSRVTVLRMNGPTGNTDELRVAARKTRKAVEGTAPAVADSISIARRTVTNVEKIFAEDITLTFLEDAVERRGSENHIARLIATAFGNDANDLAWNGDDSLSDAFLLINDGWIVLMKADGDVNDYDATPDSAGEPNAVSEVFQGMLQSMPTKFLGRTDHVYWVPVGMAQKYANEVASRLTALGDQVFVSGFPSLRYFGIPVIPEPHLQADEAVLTPAANLHYAIQRQVTVESEWQPRSRVVEYTITARDDYEYSTGEAIVLADGISAALL